MFTPLLNESSLIKDIHSVKPVFLPGPDGIPVLAYSDTVPTHVFLETAFFSIWRESLITPSFKKQVRLKQLLELTYFCYNGFSE